MDGLPNISYVLWVHGQGITSLRPNHTHGCCPSKPTEHPSCGARFVENCKTTMPSWGWCILLHEEPHAMDVLPPIPHSLWVHGQGLTTLGHNQYIINLFIQASDNPNDGTRFGENCKTTKTSSLLNILLGEEPHTMDMLSPIPYVLWVHGQGLTNLKHNQYIGVLSIQAHRAPNLWDQRI